MKKLLYIFLLFSLTSCKLFKETKESTSLIVERLDSTTRIERIIIDTIRIPAEIIKAEVPIKELKDGKEFRFRSDGGRASTRLTVENDMLKVDTQCDSLVRYIERMEVYIERLVTQNETLKKLNETKEVIVKPVPLYYRISLWIAILSILYFLFQFLKNKYKITHKL